MFLGVPNVAFGNLGWDCDNLLEEIDEKTLLSSITFRDRFSCTIVEFSRNKVKFTFESKKKKIDLNKWTPKVGPGTVSSGCIHLTTALYKRPL